MFLHPILYLRSSFLPPSRSSDPASLLFDKYLPGTVYRIALTFSFVLSGVYKPSTIMINHCEYHIVTSESNTW